MILAPSASVCRLVCRKAIITTLFPPVNPFNTTNILPYAMTITNHRSIKTSTAAEAGFQFKKERSVKPHEISNQCQQSGQKY